MEEGRPLLRGMVRNVFGGSPAAAMQHLLSESDVSDAEMAEIQRILDEHSAAKNPPREEETRS